MKTIRYTLLAILTCLVTQCGSFDASITDPKTGATFRGGVDIPQRATSDNKSTVHDGP